MRSGRRNERPIITAERPVRHSAGFQTFQLCSELQRGIADLGFTEPRPIQAKTIPSALEGRDVLGLAQTGTGKTAAFALPILERILARKSAGPRALIVAPTRELASQIQAEIMLLARHVNVTTAAVFGGVRAASQIGKLRKQPDILIACPGRLLDLYGQRVVDLSRIEVLVLDEADHMFDMGFLPDVRRILNALPKRRQNLLFSATMPREVRGLADSILHNPQVVELEHAGPAETVDHALYPVLEKSKQDLLRHVLGGPDFRSAIVFTRTKHRAKRLAERLAKQGHRAVALQGNMSQSQRERAMKGFRDGRYDVLVATDIAARGIDVAGVSHVINFDVPTTPDAYTHRIGRTGRAEMLGKAVTFITRDDADLVRAIERSVGKPIERVRVEGFEDGRREVAEAEQSLDLRPERNGRRAWIAKGGRGGDRTVRGPGRGTGGPNRGGSGGHKSGGSRTGGTGNAGAGRTRSSWAASQADPARPQRDDRPSTPFGSGVDARRSGSSSYGSGSSSQGGGSSPRRSGGYGKSGNGSARRSGGGGSGGGGRRSGGNSGRRAS